MRLLLDSRDLIDLLEKGQPCTVEECDDVLRAHGISVVLCPSHISELAPGLEHRLRTDSSVMRILNKLESLPLGYANEVKIPRLELEEALNAFLEHREVRPIDPYVHRMDAAMPLAAPSPTGMFLHYPLVSCN